MWEVCGASGEEEAVEVAGGDGWGLGLLLLLLLLMVGEGTGTWGGDVIGLVVGTGRRLVRVVGIFGR